MSNYKEEIVIRDFSHAYPAKNITIKAVKGKWRVLDWQSSTETGKLLFSYTDGAPNITIPLKAKGHYAISLGLFSPPVMKTAIQAKLSNENTFSTLKIVRPFQWIPIKKGSNLFEEHFWKITDLTGKDLQIASTSFGSGLAFVRLIPLNEEQIRLYENPEIVEWFWTLDGHGHFLHTLEPPTRIVTDDIEARTDSEFTTFSWGIIGADVVNYRTRVGKEFDTRKEPTIRDIDTTISQNISRLNEVISPCELAVETARKNNIKVFLSQRPQLWSLEPPYDTYASDFWRKNRQFACKTADDRSLMQMSFAFPEVRKHLVKVLCEAAECKPDGLHILFNRGVPCTLHEKPVLEDFHKKYEKDIRELDPLDSRVVQFRYRYITAYLRELRQAVGSDVQIAANCFATKALNDKFGLDIRHWAINGLVDHLLPGRWAWQKDDFEMSFFNEIAQSSTKCKLWFYAFNHNVYELDALPHEYRTTALNVIRAGATRLAGWDAPTDLVGLNLGHVNELKIWDQISTPISQADVQTIDGIAIDSVGTPHYGA